MKFKILGALSLAFALYFHSVSAATIYFSPSEAKTDSGGNIILNLVLDPENTKNYTVKLDLEYPSDIMQVKSFKFSDGWMALSQPGYDLIDNEKGILTKTAGYPSGASMVLNIGTITLSALKSGITAIKVMPSSLVLNGENKNVFDGSANPASIVISPSSGALRQNQSLNENALTAPNATAPVKTEEKQIQAQQPLAKEITEKSGELAAGNRQSLLASLYDIMKTDVWVVILIILTALLVIASLVYFSNFLKKSKISQKN